MFVILIYQTSNNIILNKVDLFHQSDSFLFLKTAPLHSTRNFHWSPTTTLGARRKKIITLVSRIRKLNPKTLKLLIGRKEASTWIHAFGLIFLWKSNILNKKQIFGIRSRFLFWPWNYYYGNINHLIIFSKPKFNIFLFTIRQKKKKDREMAIHQRKSII